MTIADVKEATVPVAFRDHGGDRADAVPIRRAELDEVVKDLHQVGMALSRFGATTPAAPVDADRAREAVDRAITRIHMVAAGARFGDLPDEPRPDAEPDTIELIDAAHSARRARVIMEEALSPPSPGCATGSI